MSNSFERELSRIVKQADLLQAAELRAERKRALMRKIRKISMVVVGLAAIGFAVMHREEVGQTVQKVTAKVRAPKEKEKDGVGDQIVGIQKAAQKRDAVLDELSAK